VGQQVLHEDDFPAILNFHDQPVMAALDVEYRKGINKVRVGIHGSHIGDVFPVSVSGDLMPLGNWPFECVISCDCLPPRAFADDVHSVDFAKCEVNTEYSQNAKKSNESGWPEQKNISPKTCPGHP
jgi:hypothetical protein